MNLLHDVKESWIPILEENINKLDDCKVLKQNDNYLPEYNNIFNAFKYFELDETKLVFLGQDPYINGIEIDGKFVPRTMLPLSLSYDHRIIDGAEAAKFNNELKDNLGSNFAYNLSK